MEMKTRTSSWMSLLCPEGWGPRRSRAHATSLNPFLLGGRSPNRKRGCPLARTPAILPGKGVKGGGEKKINPQEATCLVHSSDSLQVILLLLPTDWATGSPATVPTSPGIPLENIALFLSLRLFSFSIENAKYLEGVGEVSNLKEIIY